jgi:shikimate kinase
MNQAAKTIANAIANATGTAQNMQESIVKVHLLKSTTLTSVREQFGQPTADAVESVTESLITCSTVLQIVETDPISSLMLVDLLSRSTAAHCALAEKAFGLTKDQMHGAIDMAKELHTKIMQFAPK